MMKKVASSKKTYLIQDYSAKTIPSLRPKWLISILYFWLKCLKKTCPSDAGHTYRADMRSTPPPLGQSQSKVSQVNTFRIALTLLTDTCVDNLRASAWETGADLEMKIGRFRWKLVHNVVMWTYVICQSFRFNDHFLAEFRMSAPQGSPEADFQCNFGQFSIFSFSNVQLIQTKPKPY